MPHSTSIGQRFTHLIKHLGLNKNTFAQSLDKTATVIQHLVDERNKPGYDLLCKVFEIYPNVSKDWLLLGQGSMLLGGEAAPEPAATRSAPLAPELPLEPIDLSELAGPPRRPRSGIGGTRLQPADIAATLALAAAVQPARPAAPAAAPETVSPREEAPAPVEATAAPGTVAPEAPTAAPATSAPAVLSATEANLATLLHTQYLQHQLALAEQRNQHLLEQQALMQQLVAVLRER